MREFTVICPTWNRGEALRPTIDSVLAQDFDDFELVIASDGSTDDTDQIAAQYARDDARVTVLRTQHYGYQAGPTNEALAGTDSRLVAYIDHDDRWTPRHLRTLHELLETGAELAAVRATTIDVEGRRLARAHPLSLVWHPRAQVLSPLFENSCVGHRRSVLARSGGWRESEVGLEDWDLWLRMADAGAVAATTLTSTARIVAHPASRQNTLPRQYLHRLAVFDDPRAARAAIRRLADRRRREEAAAACLADLVDWYAGLQDSGDLVLPRGWAYPGAIPVDVIKNHLDDASGQWLPPVVAQTTDGWTVAMPIAVMTPEHATRFEEGLAQQMLRQHQFLATVLGGRAPRAAIHELAS